MFNDLNYRPIWVKRKIFPENSYPQSFERLRMYGKILGIDLTENSSAYMANPKAAAIQFVKLKDVTRTKRLRQINKNR